MEINISIYVSSCGRAVQTRPHTVQVRLIVAGADGCCDGIAFLLNPFLLGTGDALVFESVDCALHGSSPLHPVLSRSLPLVDVYVTDC